MSESSSAWSAAPPAPAAAGASPRARATSARAASAWAPHTAWPGSEAASAAASSAAFSATSEEVGIRRSRAEARGREREPRGGLASSGRSGAIREEPRLLEVPAHPLGVTGAGSDPGAHDLELASPQRRRRARGHGRGDIQPALGLADVAELEVGQGHASCGAELGRLVSGEPRRAIRVFAARRSPGPARPWRGRRRGRRTASGAPAARARSRSPARTGAT